MIKTLAKYVGEFKKESIITPLCMIVEVVAEMIMPILMASIVDKGVYGGDMAHIWRIGAMMVVCALIGLFGGLMGAKLAAYASAGFARNLRRGMFENTQTFAFENIDRFSPAGLITRMTTDVTNIQNAYQMILRMCMRAPATLIIALIAAFSINKKISSIYLVAVIFLGICVSFIVRGAMTHFKKVFEKYDKLNESVQENITGIRVVKAFVREDYETNKFNAAADNIYKMFCKAESYVVMNGPVMMFTVYLCILLISWIGAHMIVSDTLTTGDMMSLLTYCMSILTSLMMVSMIFVMLTLSAASAERIAEVLNEKATIVNPEDPVYEIKDGSIEFKNVFFKYHLTSKTPVLSDINIKILPGETIGIIGGTGSSKTSLINMISRLYDVTEGEVLVGGVNVKDYDLTVLRDNVSVVLQKNVLFSGTVLENLRWGKKDATLEECMQACKIACADEFIEKMPEKYDTHIEQGGANISGGQRQRLCIARAILKNPKILILDDSTSAVDTATEKKIRAGFVTELPDTTKIIIAQRISSVQFADRIIVMDNGRIDAIGPHDELVVSNEIYKDVYESQMGGSKDFDENGGN